WVGIDPLTGATVSQGCGSHAGQIFENLIEQAVEGCLKRRGGRWPKWGLKFQNNFWGGERRGANTLLCWRGLRVGWGGGEGGGLANSWLCCSGLRIGWVGGRRWIMQRSKQRLRKGRPGQN